MPSIFSIHVINFRFVLFQIRNSRQEFRSLLNSSPPARPEFQFQIHAKIDGILYAMEFLFRKSFWPANLSCIEVSKFWHVPPIIFLSRSLNHMAHFGTKLSEPYHVTVLCSGPGTFGPSSEGLGSPATKWSFCKKKKSDRRSILDSISKQIEMQTWVCCYYFYHFFLMIITLKKFGK